DYVFFFSSRRRHTRSKRDWSSDVCSSDLPNFFVIQLTPSTTLLNGFPAVLISEFPTVFIPDVALSFAFLIPSPIRFGIPFAPSTMLLNFFLTSSYISLGRLPILVFRFLMLVTILPSIEFSILFLMLFMNVVHLFFTFSHFV